MRVLPAGTRDARLLIHGAPGEPGPASRTRREVRAGSYTSLDPGEPEPEAAAELGDALGLHVERVAGAELAHRLRVERAGRRHRPQLGEELLEAGGRDDLEDPRGLVAGVPERVPLPAGLVDQVARTGLDH